MALAPLREGVIAAVATLLPTWRFIKSTRSFVQKSLEYKWYLHLAYINHVNDFDVVVDVAVEHLRGKQRICMLGAELGNIVGTGQHRWSVETASDVAGVAKEVVSLFGEVGLPFLNRFSSLPEVIHVLRTDLEMSRLIFPFTKDPAADADAIESSVVQIA